MRPRCSAFSEELFASTSQCKPTALDFSSNSLALLWILDAKFGDDRARESISENYWKKVFQFTNAQHCDEFQKWTCHLFRQSWIPLKFTSLFKEVKRFVQ
jgi:hypothetical protein